MSSFSPQTIPYMQIKRIFDVFYASIGLVMLALPLSCITLLIRITEGDPALFRQERIGKNGVPFTCYKIRSMHTDAPLCAAAALSHPEQYITPIGKFLRRTSLDEITQLYNVLRGDMSLIGPRPLIPNERTVHKARHASGASLIRPGISGLAQIASRDRLTDHQKVWLDTIYAERMSPWLDLALLARTFSRIYHSDHFKAHTKGFSYETAFILPHRRGIAHSFAPQHRHVK